MTNETALREALALAANRLSRCALDQEMFTEKYYQVAEWSEQARAAAQPPSQPVVTEGVGGFVCPICGKDESHHHGPAVVQAWRNTTHQRLIEAAISQAFSDGAYAVAGAYNIDDPQTDYVIKQAFDPSEYAHPQASPPPVQPVVVEGLAVEGLAVERIANAMAADNDSEAMFMLGDNQGGWQQLAKVAIAAMNPPLAHSQTATEWPDGVKFVRGDVIDGIRQPATVVLPPQPDSTPFLATTEAPGKLFADIGLTCLCGTVNWRRLPYDMSKTDSCDHCDCANFGHYSTVGSP